MNRDKIKNFINRGNNSKIILIILSGILILVIMMPLDKKEKQGMTGEISPLASVGEIEGDTGLNSTEGGLVLDEGKAQETTKYLEEKLTNILEKSYGRGNIDVMVNLKSVREINDNGLFYNGEKSNKNEYFVDGVLVVVKSSNSLVITDISAAVCALFDLPVCKVAVLLR